MVSAAETDETAEHAPEWTDHNVSDPGITLLTLFAFLAAGLLYAAGVELWRRRRRRRDDRAHRRLPSTSASRSSAPGRPASR